MNKIILLGRLTKNPEIRYTNNQKVVASFTLAVDRPFTAADGKKEADFINCSLWGKSAETFGNNMTKGRRTLVEGRLQIRSYEGKDGTKRQATEVVCDRFEFVDNKQTSSTNTGNQASNFTEMGVVVPFDENIPF